MSQEMMDPEIIADFIIEAKEHLETIEPNLLELEKDPANLSLLNDIFRPMHSLKGASGFLGFNLMNGLAHRAENILDELRKGTMEMTSQIMDIILEATDVLRQIIDNLETSNAEGDVDTSHLIVIIDNIMESVLSGNGVPGLPGDEGSAPATADEIAPEISDTLDVADFADAALNASDANGTDEIISEGAAGEEAGAGVARQQIGDVDEWVASRPEVEPYTLVSFGEGHLRDFIEEAKENISTLAESLLDLENQPNNDELINDMFRLFHNIKGNSGIIGYQELNSLTHEVETLLNNVRKHEAKVTPPLIDMLLLVVDVLEALILRINPDGGKTQPFDASELVDKLQKVVAGGPIEMPDSIVMGNTAPAEGASAPAPAVATEEGDDELADDLDAFSETVEQQNASIAKALEVLAQDGSNKEMVDALFRSLDTIKNACGFMGFDEVKTYAMRTADIVDKSRDTGIDFSMLHDLLDQECAILRDLIHDKVESVKAENGLTGSAGAAKDSDQESAQQADTATVTPAVEVAPVKPAEAVKPVEAKKEEASPVAPASSAPSAPSATATPIATAATATPKSAAPAVPPVPAGPATKAAPAPKAAPAKEEAPKASSTIRVDHEKLDHLMNVIGELIINRNRFSMLARQLEELDTNPDVTRIASNLSETTYGMARISDDLQATIMKVRMVPVASVFSRFPRLVRDLSRKSNKEVDLVVSGEDTELDKSVVEVIGDPLVHLIRNSVDHGIESAEERIAAGKPAKGTVNLRAFYKGNSVAIEIEDDGKGIDPDKMREVGIRKGIVTPEEAKQLEDREAIELVFAPGFSSAEQITDISGRGVGMDVVRTNIKSLKGTINISSEKGKGTTFSMSLPLTLAIIDALMVDVAGETFAIPLDAVSETTKIEASRLTDMKGRKAVTLRGDVLGIVSLAEILDLPNNMDEQELLSVVVIHDNDRRLGIVVDNLHDRQEVVIKPLGEYLGDIQGISGATIMGDGSVILILDPHEMYTLATKTA